MHQISNSQSVVQMDDLVEDVCWHLASGTTVARLGFVADGEVHIVPANFALVDRTVVMRTASGSRIDSLETGTPVVVEMDHLDEAERTGWSVIIRGSVEKLDPGFDAVLGNAVHPWADGDLDHLLWVHPTAVTGRAISHPLRPPPLRLPYMAPD